MLNQSTTFRPSLRRLLSLLLVVLFISSLSPALPALAQQETGPALTVTADLLNVHGGPNVTSPVVHVLFTGDQASVIGHQADGNWWQVRLADGTPGWVRERDNNLTINGDTTTLDATPGEETVPAGTGTLVFQANSSGPIYAVDVDRQTGSVLSGARYLTTGIDPALSPDGQWVAFTRWDNDQPGALGSLWLFNVDGSGERVILDGIHQPKSPSWSPDGSRIVLNVQDGGRLHNQHRCSHSLPDGPLDGDFEIGIEMNDDGSFDAKLCYTMLPHPYWHIEVVDVATGAHTATLSNRFSYSPTWDPANDWHVVYRDDEKGLASVDVVQNTGWALTPEMAHAPTNDLNDYAPVFSPDGTRLAVTYWQNDHWEVHTLNADGSGRVRLTETPLRVLAEQTIDGKKAASWNNAAPAWSPDGSKIAFLTDRTGRWEIWVMNADGSDQRPLFQDGLPGGINVQYNGMGERMLTWR